MKFIAVIVATGLISGAITGAASAGTLGFDTQNGGAAISAGNINGTEFTDFNVSISGNGDQLALFDSNCTVTCSTAGTDSDLATGAAFGSAPEGNVLILNGGTDAAPNDDASGGTFSFTFLQPVLFEKIRLIDLDEAGFNNKLDFTFTLLGGATESFSGDAQLGGLETLLNPAFSGDNSVRDVVFNIDKVVGLDVTFDNISGAIGSISYTPVPIPAALPLAASGLALLGALRLRRKGSAA